jgi:predicted XRE-type DNA-binding protein
MGGNMKHANDEIIKRIERAIKDKKKLTHITDKSLLSTQDKIKLSLCKHFVQYAVENRLKLKDFSEICKLDKTRLSEIMNYKINKFSVDQLLKNISVLAEKDARVREYLNLFEQVAEMPTMKVLETKKISKEMQRHVSRSMHTEARL